MPTSSGSYEYHIGLACAIARRPLGLSRSSNDSPVDYTFGLVTLYLHNPDVRVALPLAGYVSIGVGLGDGDRAGGPHPQELTILSAGLRQHRTTVRAAAVELEENSSGIRVATGHQRDWDCRKVAPPDQRLDPNLAPQPRFQRSAPLQRSSANGSRTWIANPFGFRFSASIVPPMASTLRREIHNPIPK